MITVPSFAVLVSGPTLRLPQACNIVQLLDSGGWVS
jgi:hypothetical protein